MLKVDLESGYISGSGSVPDIVTDILYVICNVHGAFAKKNKDAAEIFRKALVAGVTDPKMPTFNVVPSVAFVWTTPEKGGHDGK